MMANAEALDTTVTPRACDTTVDGLFAHVLMVVVTEAIVELSAVGVSMVAVMSREAAVTLREIQLTGTESWVANCCLKAC